MTSPLRVIVTGLIAQHPTLGGVTWDYVQYAIGLARLGHDVYYFEDSGEWPYNLDGGPNGDDWVARDPTANVQHLAGVLSRYGLGDRWAYHFPLDGRWFGLSNEKRREVLATADLLLNISGTIEHPGAYRCVRRLVYVDSDPVFTQVKLAAEGPGFAERVDGHDVHFSFGEQMSAAVPVTGHRWRPTRQPIVLSEWRPGRATRPVYTTVMNWTSYPPLTHDGVVYGQKDVEFKHFVELPARVAPVKLEVALSRTQHVNWQSAETSLSPELASLAAQRGWSPAQLAKHTGWRVVDPMEVCGDLDSYRRYIESSRGEWSVAKNGYVRGKPGWFSCRSACYLAAGRPVVAQDTGFRPVLPVGEGLFAFDSLDEAADGLQAIEGDYGRHSRAARALAKEYFDSDRVLPQLIEDALTAG